MHAAEAYAAIVWKCTKLYTTLRPNGIINCSFVVLWPPKHQLISYVESLQTVNFEHHSITFVSTDMLLHIQSSFSNECLSVFVLRRTKKVIPVQCSCLVTLANNVVIINMSACLQTIRKYTNARIIPCPNVVAYLAASVARWFSFILQLRYQAGTFWSPLIDVDLLLNIWVYVKLVFIWYSSDMSVFYLT